MANNPLQKYMSGESGNPLSKYMYDSEPEIKSNPFADTAKTVAIGAGGVLLGRKLAREIPKQTGSIFRRMAGVETKDVKKLKELGPKNVFSSRYESPEFLGTTYTPEVKNIFQSKIDELKTEYADTLGQIPRKGMVDMTNTKKVLGDILSDLELIDKSGNAIPKNLKSMSTSNPVYRKLYSVYKTISDEGKISRIRVQEMRNNINNLFKELPTDIIAQDAKLSIYKDLEKAGAKGMSSVAGRYKRVYDLEPYTERLTGEGKLHGLLKRGAKQETAGLTGRAIKQLIPEQSDQIMNELTKHRIAQQFSTRKSELYPTRAGGLRFVSRPALKGYYKNVSPVIGAVRKGLKSVGGIASKFGRTAKAIAPAAPLIDAFRYATDPEAYIIEQFIPGVSLYPKGSEKRKEQLDVLLGRIS